MGSKYMDENTILKVPIEIWAIASPFVGILIGTFSTWMVSSRRIDADLKAKTRLEWIKEVRVLTVEIINSYYIIDELHTEVTFFKMASSDMTPWFSNEYKEIKKELLKMRKKVDLYKLYFAKIRGNEANVYQYINNENIRMHNLIDLVYEETEKFKEHLETPNKEIRVVGNQKIIENFRDETSNYIKKEWDKAKDNK